MRTPKHSILVSIIGIVLMLLMLTVTSGCSESTEPEPDPDRFTLSERQNIGPDRQAYILTDNDTGKQYLVYEYYKGAGITAIEDEPEQDDPTRYAITDEERTLIERVVMAEAGGEVYAGQVAVAQCILTACEKDGLRPSEVIDEYQYSPDRPEPSESVREAVRAVFDRGEVAFQDSPLWFYAPEFRFSEFHERQRLIGVIGGHKFFGEV